MLIKKFSRANCRIKRLDGNIICEHQHPLDSDSICYNEILLRVKEKDISNKDEWNLFMEELKEEYDIDNQTILNIAHETLWKKIPNESQIIHDYHNNIKNKSKNEIMEEIANIDINYISHVMRLLYEDSILSEDDILMLYRTVENENIKSAMHNIVNWLENAEEEDSEEEHCEE